MAFQVVPDTAEVRLRFSGRGGNDAEGSTAQVSFFVRDEAVGWGASQLERLSDYAAAWLTTGKNGGLPAVSSYTGVWTCDRIVARDLGSAAGGQSVLILDAIGTGSGDSVSTMECVLVQIACDGGGFPRSGRVFWPGKTIADLVTNHWTPTHLASVRQLFVDFDADLGDPTAGGAVGWAQVRVSRSDVVDDSVKEARAALRAAIRASKRNEGLTNTVAGFTARPLVAVQKDRRPNA